jgi:protocatechuate 3,4-dioxygenase beta subunit
MVERIARRRLLALAGAVPLALAACSDDGSDEPSASAGGDDPTGTSGTATTNGPLTPTPACGDDDDPTPEQTEGPFFSSGTPERSSLREPGIDGTPLVVEGAVVATDCAPIAGVRIEIWHADDEGEYDNEGYRLRGHLFTDDVGGFRVETIVPGLYTGRTRHIHAKVQPSGGSTLTTQLYFPDEAGNADDGIFDEALIMTMGDDTDGGRLGTFTFVLDQQ